MITHYRLHDLTPSGLLAGDALTACGWGPEHKDCPCCKGEHEWNGTYCFNCGLTKESRP